MAKRGGFPGGGMPGNMANLMKQAQKMQRQMEEQAKEMETKEFSASINNALTGYGNIFLMTCKKETSTIPAGTGIIIIK